MTLFPPFPITLSTPRDHSLQEFKAWLIDQTRQQGEHLAESDFTPEQWQAEHEKYWQQ